MKLHDLISELQDIAHRWFETNGRFEIREAVYHGGGAVELRG